MMNMTNVYAASGSVGTGATRRVVLRRLGGAAAAGATGAAALALVGCGQTSSEATSIAAALPATVQITDRADAADEAVIRGELLPRLEAEIPGLRAEYLTVTGVYQDRIIAQVAGGTAPDLLWVPSDVFPQWSSTGMLKSIEPLVKRDSARAKLNDFFPALLDGSRHGGQLHGFPYLGGLFVVLYNRRLLNQAGAPLPSDLAKAGRWTWESYVDMARRAMSTTGDSPPIHGTAYTVHYNQSSSWLWGHGADWFDKAGTAMAIDTPKSVEALQFQADLIHKHRVAPTPGETVGAAGDHQRDFIAGKLASFVGFSTNSRNLLAAPDLDWDAITMPKGAVAPVSMYNFNPMAMTTQSKQVEAAWLALTFMTGQWVAQRWTERGRIVATRKSAGEQAKFLDALPPSFRELSRAGALSSRAAPVVLKQGELSRTLTPQLQAIARGQKSIVDATREMKRLGDPILKPQ
jgi:multiple sugar transport system substrate-binding protein